MSDVNDSTTIVINKFTLNGVKNVDISIEGAEKEDVIAIAGILEVAKYQYLQSSVVPN